MAVRSPLRWLWRKVEARSGVNTQELMQRATLGIVDGGQLRAV